MPDTPTPGFASLGSLSAATLATLDQLGYTAMTPIQAASLPLALAGHDLIAQAKTGSGKTAAFGLALLQRLSSRSPGSPKNDLAPSGGGPGGASNARAGGGLNPRRFGVQAAVLCPTRELAEQVTQELRRLARAADNIKILALVGGSPMRPQIASLEHGAHIVVGTPGRLMDHLQRGSLDLSALNTLVLDEADRMLDMGFYGDMVAFAKQCPKTRQTLLFSATFPAEIDQLSQRFMRQPQRVQLAEQHSAHTIRQRFYAIAPEQRLTAVAQLLNHFRPLSTLAFCNTRQQCRDLLDVLRRAGFEALALHGELEQRERDQVLIQFAQRSVSVLVATDVAARGLDIEELEAVVNVDVTPDPEVYVHRIGRTGRVDHSGWAFSLVAPNQGKRLATVLGLPECPALEDLATLTPASPRPLQPPMRTLQILGGRKEKIRPGDVLGALTGAAGLKAEQIGKITVTEQHTYVAIARPVASRAVEQLNQHGLKGKTIKARILDPNSPEHGFTPAGERRSRAQLAKKSAYMAARKTERESPTQDRPRKAQPAAPRRGPKKPGPHNNR